MFNKFNRNNKTDDNALDSDSSDDNNALVKKIDITDDNDSYISDDLEHNLTNEYYKKNTKKYKNLQDFIDKNKCAYGDKNFTHSWWDNTKNTIFTVKEEDYEDFLNIYISELDTKYGKLHIMEKPLDVGPLCLDFDVKICEGFRCLEIIKINLIIQTINKVIKKYYELSEEQDELISYVLIKNKPYYNEENNLYSDGFHIQYPNLILDVKDRFLIFL